MASSQKQLDMGGISPTFNTLYLGATRAGAMNGTEVVATAAEINARCDGDARLIEISDATTYTVLAANSGKIHVFPDFTSTCTATLPTPAAGLEYTFMYGGVAADAQNFVITATPSLLKGGVIHLDTNAGAGTDEVVSLYLNGSSHVSITLVTPGAGTRVSFISNGTLWYINGYVNSDAIPTAG